MIFVLIPFDSLHPRRDKNKKAFKLLACLTIFQYHSKSYLSFRLCICHIIVYQEEREEKRNDDTQ